MQGLPEGIDFTPLTGTMVSQVCISSAQFILRMDSEAHIDVESTCTYRRAVGDDIAISSYASAAALLCELLGDSICSVERDGNGGMSIDFTSGAVLQILNDNREYESFQVHIPPRVYVA
jgi:hypothetical protein